MINSGRVALVTGASGGIGAAICERLVQEGYRVIAIYHMNVEAARSLKLKVNSSKESPLEIFQADVCSIDDIKKLSLFVRKNYQGLDVLVNNAGAHADKLVLFSKEEDWWNVLDTNLGSVYRLCKTLLPHMIGGGGRIINISSVSGFRGRPGQTAYSASKAGIVGFTKSLAKEVSRYGIIVNCVSPGLIETEMLSTLDATYLERTLSELPAGRLGQPREVADVVVFLASEECTYMIGQDLVVDGGLTS